MAQAKRDENRVTTLIGVSTADGITPILAEINPTTGEILTAYLKKAVQIAENSGDSNLTYVGTAIVGSATSVEVWRIMRVDTTTGTIVTWADGNESFDNEWDEREVLSYS